MDSFVLTLGVFGFWFGGVSLEVPRLAGSLGGGAGFLRAVLPDAIGMV